MPLVDLIPPRYRGPGLSASELDAAQEHAGVPFPLDLCELLAATLPTGPRFPDWRRRPKESFTAFRDQMVEGIVFDVIHNAVWRESWGGRPDEIAVSEVVSRRVRDAPALIPIYGHRGIPNEPLDPGNPVFSVAQTDIIVYGFDLPDYLRREFGPDAAADASRPGRRIRFWTDLLDSG